MPLRHQPLTIRLKEIAMRIARLKTDEYQPSLTSPVCSLRTSLTSAIIAVEIGKNLLHVGEEIPEPAVLRIAGGGTGVLMPAESENHD